MTMTPIPTMTADRWLEIHPADAAAGAAGSTAAPASIRDLSAGVCLRLTGPDAVRYLNGQVTNDVRKIPQGGALPACVTNHKGKLEAFVLLSRGPGPDGAESLFVSGDGDLRDFLPLRLEKYLIADNCVLEDVTEITAMLHLFSSTATSEELAETLRPDLTEGERTASCQRFGLPGVDLWTVPERAAFWLGKFPPVTADEAATLEILHGVPAWGRELTPDILPPEAGLETTAIDFHKGCYIGQEIISRLRSVGHVNRQLTLLIQTDGPPAQPGWSLFPTLSAADAGTVAAPKAAGTVTSAADHPVTGRRHLLAFVKRSAADSPLSAGPAETGPQAAVVLTKVS